MDEYNYYKRCEIPAFGSWDCYDGLPFTQCFDTASRHPTAAGLFRYSYPNDRDLYVAGDLYANDVVTPTMIVVPRRRRTKVRGDDNVVDVKGDAKAKGGNWVGGGGFEEPLSPTPTFVTSRPTPKPVDEDLYKIPSEFLHAKPRKKRGLRFFTCCSVPTCAL
ncbi:uncharacterized protein LOC116212662 [Punica granatum]|uniref:Uncharacterized protein n=2 Tax=Punica granatum TaxID=22663 RepID=A0A218VR19_PUNGR|nr:uncharacterized protein LOC116212662 [Punica granatum]OWM62749.1 hypothetical protein CDL15_Pgr020043 [Punica granatum]PKI59163.1 hypothetical protein CRG98_020428 [Punica granatum]